jgi:hypothetical protein
VRPFWRHTIDISKSDAKMLTFDGAIFIGTLYPLLLIQPTVDRSRSLLISFDLARAVNLIKLSVPLSNITSRGNLRVAAA